MIRTYTLTLLFSLTFGFARCQETTENTSTEEQLEDLAGAEDAVTEDDSFAQALESYKRHPLNLNYADENELEDLQLLSTLQIKSLLNYRRLLGLLINKYELQAVPGWDLMTIKKVLPYIIVSTKQNLARSFKERWKGGERQLLGRTTYVIEKSKGYRLKGDTSAKNYYPGGGERLLLRYKYGFRNLLQYGFTAEKDPGESLFKNAQRMGFDFYSAHLFMRNTGIIKALAIGDYTVNLGQGLMHWQSLAFKKSAEVMHIKRQSSIIRPYTSTGEFYFHRGAAITLQKKYWEMTLFGSFRKLDGNTVTDTLNNKVSFSSILKTGYHRTQSEIEDRQTVHQLSWGGNITYRELNTHIGLNFVAYRLNHPLQKKDDPYNKFSINGDSWFNMGIDYSFTKKNVHWFGEVVLSRNNGFATINGMLMSLSGNVDLSVLYRYIDKTFQSLYGNAFTENTMPANESGFYTGIELRLFSYLKIAAYSDIFKFPWLRFRTDAPSQGMEYMLQATYKPNKQVEIYSRFRNDTKGTNYKSGTALNSPVMVSKMGWRTQAGYEVSREITLRYRIENLWFEHPETGQEEGFLTFVDFTYKPMVSRLSGGIRLQYFESGSYDSRVFAYENDLLYSYSIPAFFNKGHRWYLNLNYDLTKFITCWFRVSQSISGDENYIGSGLDEIGKKHRTEIKFQFLWRIK